MVIRGVDSTGVGRPLGITLTLTRIDEYTLEVDGNINFQLISISNIRVGGTANTALAGQIVVDNNRLYLPIDGTTTFNIGTVYTLNSGDGQIITDGTIDSAFRIYPADRCVWTQEPVENGYAIRNVVFYPGNAAGTNLVSARLGYIGKSGRFVEIAR